MVVTGIRHVEIPGDLSEIICTSVRLKNAVFEAQDSKISIFSYYFLLTTGSTLLNIVVSLTCTFGCYSATWHLNEVVL